MSPHPLKLADLVCRHHVCVAGGASARGWASVLQGNERARTELQRFLARPDTFSLGVCNGCQVGRQAGRRMHLPILLALITPPRLRPC